MKKKIIYAFLLPLLLVASCGGGGEEQSQETSSISSELSSSTLSSSEDTGVQMEADPATNYVFENVDNSRGSMSYEIFTRSFYDANGNGIGDLKGITTNLDYLKRMGIKTLWLTPIHPSPTYHGYDVKDYFDVSFKVG